MLLGKTLHRRANIQGNFYFNLFNKSDDSAFEGVGQNDLKLFLKKAPSISKESR
jgi:hypothetical protein